jgi:glucosamine-6-phosphate deaminase
MKIKGVEDYVAMSEAAKEIIIGRVRGKPSLVLALPTGKTPELLYSMLVEEHKKGLDLSRVVTFNLDEYVGLDPTSRNSYHHYMEEKFLKWVKVKESHIPNGMALDLEKECMEYEKKIVEVGGIDLAILGIGRDGHIGFNEPGTSFESRTHVAETPAVNSNAPKKAITMGIKTIREAKEIVLLASGREKAKAVKMMVRRITEEVPASILQKHENCEVIVDREASIFLNS